MEDIENKIEEVNKELETQVVRRLDLFHIYLNKILQSLSFINNL